MVGQPILPGFFDVPYGIASINITTGVTVVATTGASYFGFGIESSATVASIVVYDNASTTSGNKLDLYSVIATVLTRPDRFFVVQAKNGITVDLQGAGAKATLFYGPKG